MSVWSKFTGKVVLSGREYDGKGFGLYSVWFDQSYNSKRRSRTYFHVLNNGKLTKHHSSQKLYDAWNKINVPCGSEGSVVIDITESKLTGKIYVYFNGNLRDYFNDKKLRDWILSFIKARKQEGWTIECDFEYGLDSNSKDRLEMHRQHQDCVVETLHDWVSDHEIRETCMINYFPKNKKSVVLYEETHGDLIK